MIIMNNDDNSVDHDDNARPSSGTIKEEMEDLDEEDSGSTISSPPLLPIRPTPTSTTSLFQPFLPASHHHPGSLGGSGGLHLQDSPQHHKPLPFSIDNILRPTFGGQTATAVAARSALFSTPFFHSSFVAAFAAAAAAATLPMPLPHPLQQQQQQPGVLSVASTPSVLTATSPISPPLSTTSSTSSTPIHSSLVKKEPKLSSSHHHINDPVDLSSKNHNHQNHHHNNNNNNNDNHEGGSDKTSADDLPSGLKRDEDCPPGMVRGPNGQLWPAWVFCTRYSDRPSSGKYILPEPAAADRA